MPNVAYNPLDVSIGAELQDFVMDEYSIVQVIPTQSSNGEGFKVVLLDFRGSQQRLPCPSLSAALPFCSNCKRTTEKMKRCSRCHRVYYCSSFCQLVDWSNAHKKNCSAY